MLKRVTFVILIILFSYSVFSINRGFDNPLKNIGDNSFVEANYDGFIIEFVDKPVLERKIELENIAINNQEYIEKSAKYNPIALAKRAFSILPEDVPKEIQKYSKDLDKNNDKIERVILTKLKKDVNKVTGNVIKEMELVKLGSYKYTFNGIALDLTDKQAREVEKISGVKKVWPNTQVHILLEDSVPLIQEGIHSGNLDSDGNDCIRTGKVCLTGRGIRIAIIDTGIDYTHLDLGGCTEQQFLDGRCEKVIGGHDFANDDNDPMDDNGHGTHVAAIVAGNGVLKGVAPEAKIYAYKVLNGSERGLTDDVIDSIERSLDPNQDGDISDHVDIISMSIGREGNPDDPLSRAVDNVVDMGVVAVIAAGNSGPIERTIGSPGTARKVITVGANDKIGKIADFSSRGAVVWTDNMGEENAILKPDITAPGVSICAAQSFGSLISEDIFKSTGEDIHCIDDNHIFLSGTSMATPHVSGAVALIKQAHPGWTPEEIKSTIKGTATDLINPLTGKPYPSFIQGAGMINIKKAISSSYPQESPWDFYIYSDDVKNIYDKLLIKGIFPEDYDLLAVDWRKNGNLDWKKDGISIVDNGVLIAEFNPVENILDTGIYEFKARIVKEGIEIENIIKIYFDKDLFKGWPKTIGSYCSGKCFFPTDITLADVNGDGEENIVVALKDKIYILGADGTPLEGWPVNINEKTEDNAIILSDISVNDFDNDGKMEIVVADNGGNLHVFHSDGSYASNWPVNLEGDLLSTPSIGDVNGDGKKEIVVFDKVHKYPLAIELYRKVHVFNFNGEEISTWSTSSILHSLPTLADLDNDDMIEIISTCDERDQQGVCVLDYQGNYKKGWPFFHENFTTGIPITVGDVDSDGIREVVALSGNGWVFVLDSLGTIRQEEKVGDVNYHSLAPPVISNLNADNNLEILIGAGSTFYVLDSNGSLIFKIKRDDITDSGSPVVVNVDQDSSEFFTSASGSGSGLWIDGDINFPHYKINSYDNKGNLVKTLGTIKSIIYSNIAVGDINNDGKLDLIASNLKDVYAWNLNAPYNSDVIEWPMFQHDPQHTGLYTNIKIPAAELVLKGDFNQDGCVNLDDFFLFADNYQKEINRDNKRFDLDENEKIDVEDFFIFAENWNKCI